MGLGNKEIMAKNIKKLMKRKGVNASTICGELGFPMATFSDWCNAKTYPRIDKIEMLANYFGVPKSELVEEEITEFVEPYYYDADARDLAQFVFENPDYKILFDASRKVKRQDIGFVVELMDRMRGDVDDTGC